VFKNAGVALESVPLAAQGGWFNSEDMLGIMSFHCF
jgi:hypothetical protein